MLTLATPLANGDYVWSVTADNGYIAENSPFAFTIDSVNRTELVGNGGFESNTKKKVPRTWTASKLGKSVSVCESGSKHPEYQGKCAFVFAGGSNTTLTQTLSRSGLTTGQILTLSASMETQRAVAGAQITLKVTYTNGKSVTSKIKPRTQTRPWQTLQRPADAERSVKKVVLTIKYTGKSGKVLFDNVSVIRSAP